MDIHRVNSEAYLLEMGKRQKTDILRECEKGGYICCEVRHSNADWFIFALLFLLSLLFRCCLFCLSLLILFSLSLFFSFLSLRAHQSLFDVESCVRLHAQQLKARMANETGYNIYVNIKTKYGKKKKKEQKKEGKRGKTKKKEKKKNRTQ